MTLISNIKYGMLIGTMLSLTACGGGSGNGNIDTKPITDNPEIVDQPVDYAKDSVTMTTVGVILPEEIIRLAELVSQQIQAKTVQLDQTNLCKNGGNIKWNLQDNDANQVISVGDKLVGTLNECSIVNTILRGTVQVDVIAPTTKNPQTIAFSA